MDILGPFHYHLHALDVFKLEKNQLTTTQLQRLRQLRQAALPTHLGESASMSRIRPLRRSDSLLQKRPVSFVAQTAGGGRGVGPVGDSGGTAGWLSSAGKNTPVSEKLIKNRTSSSASQSE